MRIAISNDHAGFPLKPAVVDAVRARGHDVIDVGTTDDAPCDFPVMTRKVTDLVTSRHADRGILVCGTGVGAAIAANKVPGIRAAVVHDTHVARQGVEHDDVNVACLGAWIVGPRIAEDAVVAFLSATFGTGPDVRRRVAQLAEMERAAGAKAGGA
ncbi:RpiB/LacA/LacB family sugar-phosphate isomerase [Saccharopolyspora erythraea]|uniref:RpiB/LacA/LacB family sugar-phosphate isomerase n=1 Tax=Saccharopolyspora erythraea TaxID=1836 RepID=UPI001BAA84FE|nr:RpiB/LacA/LacB family sugar-phosphate isomerase [Saccharopolyspora erythraea]QUH01834.1 RpiB/LacA/LacB family sugar-phosphate isomerase [Saccharopolyspora erythraea]